MYIKPELSPTFYVYCMTMHGMCRTKCELADCYVM